jgi:hypothetical protein
MRRLLCLLLIAIFGTMPLAGMAKSLGAALQDAEDMREMQAMKDMPCHQSAPKPADQAPEDCGYCKGASHCCLGFILPPPAIEPVAAAGVARITGVPTLGAGIVIPPLEPPPLAS